MKKIEFSKLITIIAVLIFAIYGIWAGIEYYSLCRYAIQNHADMPDATLAITCVSTIIGALVSYCLYQFGLKNSRNKYGVDSDGQPFMATLQDTFEDLYDIDIDEEEEEDDEEA